MEMLKVCESIVGNRPTYEFHCPPGEMNAYTNLNCMCSQKPLESNAGIGNIVYTYICVCTCVHGVHIRL